MERHELSQNILYKMELLFTEEEMAAYFEEIEMTPELYDSIGRNLAFIDVDMSIVFVTKYSYLLEEPEMDTSADFHDIIDVVSIERIISRADLKMLRRLKKAIEARELEIDDES